MSEIQKTNRVEQILKQMPMDPGVYIMKNDAGEIIYIGKAVKLKRRVSSYFRKQDNPKTAVLVKNIADIEYIVTDSEMEALILESSLVRKHMPKFNIRLKDDKRFPYIAVTMGEEYPRIIFTRKTAVRSSRYFGPYTDAAAARNIADMVNTAFRLRTCKRDIPVKEGERPCLNYQIKKCCGVCTGKISREEYLSLVAGASGFLEGDIEPVLAELHASMNRHAEAMHYEKAAAVRDIIFDINRMTEEQKVSISMAGDMDYINVGVFGTEALLVLFEFRKGVLLGRKINIFDNGDIWEPGDIIRSFILDYYSHSEIPSRIISPFSVKDRNAIEQLLTKKASKKIMITGPGSDEDRGILNMISKNIDVTAADREASRYYQNMDRAASQLQELLGLEKKPEEIVCFDISNLQGTNSVASMVTFRNGAPDKSSYRRFRIRGHEGPNDPAMIHEAVSRRLQFLVNENLPLPDIMLIDGGTTQLTRAIEAASNFGIDLCIISLAERFEDIYFSPSEPPLKLPETAPARKLLQQVRDEAHRFAITYHRQLREKDFLSSEMDRIPGVGTKTVKILLKHFSSMEEIRTADMKKLMEVKDIGPKTAKAIYDFFRRKE